MAWIKRALIVPVLFYEFKIERANERYLASVNWVSRSKVRLDFIVQHAHQEVDIVAGSDHEVSRSLALDVYEHRAV